MAPRPRNVGEFCWINVLSATPDVERQFFGSLFGWTYAEIPGMGHTILAGGEKVGGLFPNLSPDGKNGAPPGMYVMVRVADAAATGNKAVSLGGKAEPPMDIGPMGRMVQLVDPNGAGLDLWQTNDGGVMTADAAAHGAPSWFETITSDASRASKFYCDLFGWNAEDVPMGDGTYTILKQGAERVAGLMRRLPSMGQMPPHWGVYFTVKDVNATAAQVASLGGTVAMPPTDIAGVGRFCCVVSPGNVMCYAITYAM